MTQIGKSDFINRYFLLVVLVWVLLGSGAALANNIAVSNVLAGAQRVRRFGEVKGKIGERNVGVERAGQRGARFMRMEAR